MRRARSGDHRASGNSTMNRGEVQLMSGTQAHNVDDLAVTPGPNEKSLSGYQDLPTDGIDPMVHARTRREGSVSDAKNRVPMQPSAELVRTCNAQAHEMVDAIAAAVTNAQAALNWLRGAPPDLEEVHQALNDIVSAGKRAAEVAVRLHSPT